MSRGTCMVGSSWGLAPPGAGMAGITPTVVTHATTTAAGERVRVGTTSRGAQGHCHPCVFERFGPLQENLMYNTVVPRPQLT